MKSLSYVLAAVLLTGAAQAAEEPNPEMVLDTTEGVIVIELFAAEAPNSVANIIQYVEEGFYTDTIFHRVISGFMIQGGGFDQHLRKKPVRDPIQNEANNGLKNQRGTVALARTSDPHSATAQFYINTVNNGSLNHRGETEKGWGYTVFGQVIEGMNVVDRIARAQTQTRDGRPDVPALPILIERASIRRPTQEEIDARPQ